MHKCLRYVRCAAPLVAVLLVLSGCQNFQKLKADLNSLEIERFQAFGTLEDKTDSGNPLMVLYLGHPEGSVVLDAIPMEQSGSFELWLDSEEGWLFAFADANGDSQFQLGESYGWANDAKPLNANRISVEQLYIPIQAPGSGQALAPAQLVGRPVFETARLSFAKTGETASPLDARFSREAAVRGLWQPYTTLQEGNAGIFFVDPYDPDKVPVLFVHGIAGFPAQFSELIDSLDHDKYQAWFMNYPSGFYLGTLSNGLWRALEQMRRHLGFSRMHLVAHSMGGLVAQSYIQICQKQAACEYLQTFISVASPFDGMDSAALGVDYAPESIPSWRDLAPGSSFLATLFEEPLPPSVSHYLLFAYHNDQSLGDLISAESSDSVVPLRSQLRPKAQKQATQLAGFDQTHVGVLSDPSLLARVKGILSSQDKIWCSNMQWVLLRDYRSIWNF